MVIQRTPDECLDVGLKVSGFGRIRQWSETTMLHRFRGHYRVSPDTCSAVFGDIQTTPIVEVS
jgi:hypothetical protein